MGKEDATNRVHLNKHIYLIQHVCTYIQPTIMQSCRYEKAMDAGRAHEQGEALQPTTINDVQALKQFYLPGHGATTFIQNKKQE